ncbi:MAG: DciA family protein [Stellaceae bacterium]
MDGDSAPDAGARRPGLRAVGVAVTQVAAPILKRRSGILARLKADWPVIVGPRWAAVSWPLALGRDGALKLRVMPTAALDMQHRAPLVIERITRYFSRPVAERLLLVQGPLPLAPRPAAPASPPPLSAGAKQTLDRRLADIPDADLRAALARLGHAVLAAEADPAGKDPAAGTPKAGTS